MLLKGIAGPRGRTGKAGTNGIPGTPGIQAWSVTVNGTSTHELLIPPSIVGEYKKKSEYVGNKLSDSTEPNDE